MSQFLTDLEIENLCSTGDVEHQKRKLTACKVPFVSTPDGDATRANGRQARANVLLRGSQ